MFCFAIRCCLITCDYELPDCNDLPVIFKGTQLTMLELSYPNNWCKSVSTLEEAIWRKAQKHFFEIIIWNNHISNSQFAPVELFFFSPAYFLFLGQHFRGFIKTGLSHWEEEVVLTFTFYCYRIWLWRVLFTHLGYKERYFLENKAVELSPLTCS